MQKLILMKKKQNIEIDITLEITQEDLELLHRLRKVSSLPENGNLDEGISEKAPIL